MPPLSSTTVVANQLETSISMDDYVVVLQPDELRGDDDSLGAGNNGGNGDDDDASYDYCEDVFSDGESDADDDDDDDDQSVTLSISSDSGAQKDRITISVPSILMKDLDEAHAAAKLARVPDLSVENATFSTPDEDSPTEEARDEWPSSFSYPITKDANKQVATKASIVASKSRSAATRTDGKNSSSSASTAHLSRTSNKKRRKQLKLLKKARAAANAAQTVTGRAPNATTNGKAKKVATSSPASHTTPNITRGTSRKVANLAVACARETMASYRQEILCSTMG